MRAFEADVDLDVVKRGADEPEGELAERITRARNNAADELFSAPVVAGTAWLFSHPDFEQAFDYLFVDEAGQVSLANLVGMSTAARNIVLVGEPAQTTCAQAVQRCLIPVRQLRHSHPVFSWRLCCVAGSERGSHSRLQPQNDA